MLLQPELLLLLLQLQLQLVKLLLEMVLLLLLAGRVACGLSGRLAPPPNDRERCADATRVRSSEESLQRPAE